jgi:hypothetical protein
MVEHGAFSKRLKTGKNMGDSTRSGSFVVFLQIEGIPWEHYSMGRDLPP